MAEKDPKTSVKPKSSQNLLEIIWGVVEGYPRKTLILIVVGNLLFAGVVIGGTWYYLAHRKPETVQLDPQNSYTKNIRRLEKQSLPSDPMEQATYYSQLGSNYETLKVYQKALEYYLKAQEVVERHQLQNDISFNQSIGDMYVQLNNRHKAREYYNKEIARLGDYKKQHPEEASGVDQLIKNLQGKAKDQ